MAAISRVLTIRLVATRLGEDEDLLWDLADAMEPEDGKIWIVDRDDQTDGTALLAFTTTGVERLQELLAEQRQNPPP